MSEPLQHVELDKLAEQLKVWRQTASLLEDNFTIVGAEPLAVHNDPLLRITLDMPSGYLTVNQQIALRDLFLQTLIISLEDKERMADLAREYEAKITKELIDTMGNIIADRKEH